MSDSDTGNQRPKDCDDCRYREDRSAPAAPFSRPAREFLFWIARKSLEELAARR